MGQKLEIRKFILANTTPFFGSNFHVQTEKNKKKTKQNKATIKKKQKRLLSGNYRSSQKKDT